jgi:hypothetical protein
LNGARIVGILLIVVGVLALAYGGFSYTDEKPAAKVGPIVLSVNEQHQVNVPMWAGAAMLAAGAALLVFGGKRS